MRYNIVIIMILCSSCGGLYENEIVGEFRPNYIKNSESLYHLQNDSTGNSLIIMPLDTAISITIDSDHILKVYTSNGIKKFRWQYIGIADGVIQCPLLDYKSFEYLGTFTYHDFDGSLYFDINDEKTINILGNRIVFQKENFESPYLKVRETSKDSVITIDWPEK